MTQSLPRDDLTTLIEVPTTFEAEAIAAMLAEEDIDAMIIAPSALDVAISAGRRSTAAIVRVRTTDLDRARTAIHDARQTVDDIDWDAMDVDDETRIPSHAKASRVMMWIGFAIAVALIAIVLVVAVIMLFAG